MSFLAVAMLCFFAMSPKKAQAQDMVFSPSSMADAIVTISNLASQLDQINNTFNQVRQDLDVQNIINKALGQAGAALPSFGSVPGLTQGNQGINQLLALGGMGFSLYNTGQSAWQQLKFAYEDFINRPLNAQTAASIAMSVRSNLGRFRPLINTSSTGASDQIYAVNEVSYGNSNMADATETMNNAFYTNSSTPSAAMVQRTETTRQGIAENTDLQALVVASSAISSQTHSLFDSQPKMLNMSTKSQTARADIQANSAMALKLLEQEYMQNEVLAWIVQVRTVSNIQNQNHQGATTQWTNSVAAQ